MRGDDSQLEVSEAEFWRMTRRITEKANRRNLAAIEFLLSFALGDLGGLSDDEFLARMTELATD